MDLRESLFALAGSLKQATVDVPGIGIVVVRELDGYGRAEIALDVGNLTSSRFCFENQQASLLDEELALLRGVDDFFARPVYNRLFWNFNKGEGEAAYARARPLLQALTAAIEPLSRAELAAASGLDAEEELPRLLRRLAQLHVRRDRPNGEETIAFYHKSIADWLVSNPDGNAFAISPAKGRALLAAFCRSALDTSRAEPCWWMEGRVR